ncbi:MAG TPA: transmembrane 220 family protein [Rhodothermales bacterium]|nr:transmembrane 220 family protein [Rhodothermales bacterium]
MKIVDVIFTLLLVVFAALQMNDPDPWIWVPLYGAAALVPALALFNRLSLVLALVVIAACVVGMAVSASGFYQFLTQGQGHTLMEEMSDAYPFIEETREFLGLLITVAVLAYYAFRARRAKKTVL